MSFFFSFLYDDSLVGRYVLFSGCGEGYVFVRSQVSLKHYQKLSLKSADEQELCVI